MSDLIEVYTRLKMKTNCLITLTFFLVMVMKQQKNIN